MTQPTLTRHQAAQVLEEKIRLWLENARKEPGGAFVLAFHAGDWEVLHEYIAAGIQAKTEQPTAIGVAALPS